MKTITLKEGIISHGSDLLYELEAERMGEGLFQHIKYASVMSLAFVIGIGATIQYVHLLGL
jgi:hypothetical protein